jgi:beta-1,4-mannosyl-glycoprotein beta-1,4-N-acetylglucosaminyltransferase
MKIYDCLIYFNEDLLLDIRFNYLNKFVDKFVIVESTYTHSGKKRELSFDVNKFPLFKKKIIYIVLDKEPENIFKVKDSDTSAEVNSKHILNGAHRLYFQRNYITKGIEEASPEDMIILSDADEIPNLDNINFNKIKNKFIFFKQFYYYYKLNLKADNFIWYGSKACKKRHLISPQWLRDIKDKHYPFWRLDIFFHKKKFRDILRVPNGGWHFSKLNTPEEIVKLMKSYAHFREFDLNPLSADEIRNVIKNKKAIYNLNVDKTKNKFDLSQNLSVSHIKELPKYISENYDKFKEWIA